MVQKFILKEKREKYAEAVLNNAGEDEKRIKKFEFFSKNILQKENDCDIIGKVATAAE